MIAGDVCQLKSGGPLMTVETFQPIRHLKILGYKLERPAYVTCVWYERENLDYVRDDFLPAQLQLVTAPKEMTFRELREFERSATARRSE
jgi:uncharacterized protein YodC (DUF2158 family)